MLKLIDDLNFKLLSGALNFVRSVGIKGWIVAVGFAPLLRNVDLSMSLLRSADGGVILSELILGLAIIFFACNWVTP